MPVLVDTNVLIDVLTDDPQWAQWSIAQLERNSSAGLVINPVVYAELCFGIARLFHRRPRRGSRNTLAHA